MLKKQIAYVQGLTDTHYALLVPFLPKIHQRQTSSSSQSSSTLKLGGYLSLGLQQRVEHSQLRMDQRRARFIPRFPDSIKSLSENSIRSMSLTSSGFWKQVGPLETGCAVLKLLVGISGLVIELGKGDAGMRMKSLKSSRSCSS